MATLTRSSRRIDGLHSHHANANTHLLATSAARNAAQNLFPRGSTGRGKRSLDGSDCDLDPLTRKRAKITVEIGSHAPNSATRPPVRSVASAPTILPQRPQQQPRSGNSLPPQHPTPNAPAKPPSATSTNPPIDTTTRATTATTATTATSKQSEPPPEETKSNLKKHQSKVKNGILHELDSLQPATADTKPQGRKLRSQETSRFKSELSAYFPEYDEIIGNEPKETHLFNIDTPIVILDTPHDATQQRKPDTTALSTRHTNSIQSKTAHGADGVVPYQTDDCKSTSHHPAFPAQYYGDALFDELYDAQRVDFDFLEPRYKGKPLDDPLPDSYFKPTHKKAERLEKSIRNAEKGRAQHERDRIIRLHDGLQGHDWLRVMGVSGITETRKKSFEPARDHFIRGCEAILDKFRRWSREEKRRKQEKDRAASELAHGKESVSGNGGPDDRASLNDSTSHNGEEDATSHRDDGSTVSETISDVDASIEKQLHEEVMARSRMPSDPPTTALADATAAAADNVKAKDKEADSKQGAKARAKASPKTMKHNESEPGPTKAFTSFFAKKHERDAALSRGRRTGRKALAWGQPVPDMAEADYELPEQVRDAETMKVLARKKRRDRRGTKS